MPSRGLHWCPRCGRKRVIFDFKLVKKCVDPWYCMNCHSNIPKRDMMGVNNGIVFRKDVNYQECYSKVFKFGDF